MSGFAPLYPTYGTDPDMESCNTRDRHEQCSVVPVETLRAAQGAVS